MGQNENFIRLTRARTPLDIFMVNDFQYDDDHVQSLVACRRLLLNAGADPTIVIYPRCYSSAFFTALITSKTVGVDPLDLFKVHDLTFAIGCCETLPRSSGTIYRHQSN